MERTHVTWLETVSVRWVECQPDAKEATLKGDKYFRPVRRKIKVAVPSKGSTFSQFAAEMEELGNEAAAGDAYIGGATIDAGQKAQADLAVGKVTSAKIDKYVLDNLPRLMAQGYKDATAMRAAAMTALSNHDCTAESNATEEDVEVLKKRFRTYKDAWVAEAAGRAAKRIGTTG